MLPFLAKAMIPVVTVFITAVGVFKGIDYVKSKLNRRKNKNPENKDGFV